MSDFLSQFSNSTPDSTTSATAKATDSTVEAAKNAATSTTDPVTVPVAKSTAKAAATIDPTSSTILSSPLTDIPIADTTQPSAAATDIATRAGVSTVEHQVEEDPGYRRRIIQRTIIIVLSVLIIGIGIALIWYFSRLVEVPELTGKAITQAQAFGNENDIKLDITEEFSLTADAGIVLEQDVAAGDTIPKGSTLRLLISKGADPDELLALPDFSKMNKTSAEQWITEHRANNLRVVSEYSATVPSGEFIRLEFRSSETTSENYHRRDYATLYYSKGAEQVEKNITMPDFKGKMRAEVEAWVKDNSIELTINEQDSDSVPVGTVVSQSVAAGEKVAKNDALSVTISLGKAIIVPNFAAYDASSAPGAAEGLMVEVRTRYHSSVAYGRLISQSIGAGAKLMPGDNLKVTVVYSEGLPFLKDFRGTSEGDLAQIIFNDYTSKGANLTYELRYVDSYETKGTVTRMSDYSLFIPLDYHVIFYISRGNLTPPTPDPPVVQPGTEASTDG